MGINGCSGRERSHMISHVDLWAVLCSDWVSISLSKPCHMLYTVCRYKATYPAPFEAVL